MLIMSASPAVHTLSLRVYAADTDVSGIVHHSQYLVFAERARTEMLRDHGIAGTSLGDVGAGFWIVRRAAVDYRNPARLDDELMVLSRVVAARGASCDIEQRVERGEETLVQIDITAAFLDDQGRPMRMAAGWRSALASLAVGARDAW